MQLIPDGMMAQFGTEHQVIDQTKCPNEVSKELRCPYLSSLQIVQNTKEDLHYHCYSLPSTLEAASDIQRVL